MERQCFFGAGMWLSTFLLNPFFLNFPVKGKPRGIRGYITAGAPEHFLGLCGE